MVRLCAVEPTGADADSMSEEGADDIRMCIIAKNIQYSTGCQLRYVCHEVQSMAIDDAVSFARFLSSGTLRVVAVIPGLPANVL